MLGFCALSLAVGSQGATSALRSSALCSSEWDRKHMGSFELVVAVGPK